MSTARPRGVRLLTAFSPKLGQPVSAFDHVAFNQWVRLEADRSVITICEPPCRAGADDDGPLIDFWAARSDEEVMLVVERRQATPTLACTWLPSGSGMHGHLHFCTACMGLVCQGVMHQRTGASRCPWHGIALEEHCRGSGSTAPYRLNARLLGSPFRCAECRRPYPGWSVKLLTQPAPPGLRRAITRARFGG